MVERKKANGQPVGGVEGRAQRFLIAARHDQQPARQSLRRPAASSRARRSAPPSCRSRLGGVGRRAHHRRRVLFAPFVQRPAGEEDWQRESPLEHLSLRRRSARTSICPGFRTPLPPRTTTTEPRPHAAKRTTAQQQQSPARVRRLLTSCLLQTLPDLQPTLPLHAHTTYRGCREPFLSQPCSPFDFHRPALADDPACRSCSRDRSSTYTLRPPAQKGGEAEGIGPVAIVLRGSSIALRL